MQEKSKACLERANLMHFIMQARDAQSVLFIVGTCIRLGNYRKDTVVGIISIR